MDRENTKQAAGIPSWGRRRGGRSRGTLPGFGLAMGYTMIYLSLIVLLPLAGLTLKSLQIDRIEFWETITSPRAMASYRLSLGASLVGATLNTIFGLLSAWVLVRYRFPFKRFVDSLVDLPIALPTAVAGISLTALYSSSGWLGKPLSDLGIKVAFAPLGVVIALTFVGLPFVVRTVQPVLEDLKGEVEEAAASLGATRLQTFRRVIFPTLRPALFTGFAMAFARAIGEYGSVVFISGNMPMRTEITPLLIVTKLEQYDYDGAVALAMVLLIVAFIMLLLINVAQVWTSRHRAFQ